MELTIFCKSVLLVTFVRGWIVQFAGHCFEGRKPALTDNLFQVFVAPVFLMAKLFFAIGLKPELHDAVNRMVEARMRSDNTKNTAMA